MKIPIIQQQTSVGGGLPAPRAEGVQVVSPIGNAGAVAAQGLGELAHADVINARTDAWLLKKQDEQDAVAWSGKTLSDATLLWQGNLDKRKETAGPAAANFTPGLMGDFDKWAEDTLGSAPTDTSKRFLGQHLLTLRTNLGDKALAFEAQSRQQYRSDQVLGGIDSASKAVLADPSQFVTLYAQNKAVIDALEVPPTERIKLQNSLHDQLSQAAVLGMIQRDPEGAATLLRGSVTPAAPAASSGSSSSFPGGAGAAAGVPNVADLRADPKKVDESTWDRRPDGTKKGHGFLGLLRVPDGSVASEYSVGVEINGKNIDIPSLVPTLTRSEVEQTLKAAAAQKFPPDSVIEKATAFAKQRMAEGKPVFAGPQDEPGAATSVPRGIRNNNPGNIVRGESQWQGEVSGKDPRYSSFESPEAGVRALGRNIIAYQDKHGINTVQGIISRWAPATENDTTGYITKVSQALGVKPDEPINVKDPKTLRTLATAIIGVENGPAGAKAITSDQMDTGLSAALANRPTARPQAGQAAPAGDVPSTGAGSPQAAPQAVPMGNTAIDSLSFKDRLNLLTHAESAARQQQAGYREDLKGRVQDSTAAYLTSGSAPNPPGEADFIRGFGQAEGVARYRQFQDVAQLGARLQDVRTLPLADLERLRESQKPAAGDGFADRQKNYEILTKAIDQVQQARQHDPVAYALSTNAYGFKPIENLSDPNAIATEVSRRVSMAGSMARDYGTQPEILTQNEAKAFSAVIKAVPVEQQKQYLSALWTGVQDMPTYKRLMQQIAPDAPVLAAAGIMQARHLATTSTPGRQATDVADLVLRGHAILQPPGKEDGANHAGGKSLIKMPEDKLMLADWTSQTGDAFKGKEGASDLFMQTAKSIYAARSAEDGDYSGTYNARRWKSAIDLATGGIQNHNGADIVMPYGMPYAQFQTDLTAKAARVTDAVETTPQEIQGLPLENVGDGRYLVRRGTGYLVNKDGRPVTLDFNRPEAPNVGEPTSLPITSLPPRAFGRFAARTNTINHAGAVK